MFKKGKSSIRTTHEAFGFLLIIAQCFATFPVSGVLAKNVKNLKVSFKDVRIYYGFVYLTLLIIDMGLYILKIVEDIRFGYFVSLLFFTCSFVTTIMFLLIARTWPKLMLFWTEIDVTMEAHNYGFPKGLHKKLKIITTFVMTIAILEHSFFLMHASSNIPMSGFEAVNNFLETMHSQLFKLVPYSFPLGIIFQLVSTFSTFTWNFMDLFIMVISTALADRFRQVSTRISNTVRLKISDLLTWKQIREDYNRLSVLCKKIDHVISDLILLSFANNIFVILVQLVNTLEPKSNNDVIGRLYFMYSFGFLILRTVFVCLFASRVYEESQSSIDDFNSLPNPFYNIEIERLLQQIKVDPCCLTGRKLFYVRKPLILSIAGAIVTYELILIQFNITY